MKSRWRLFNLFLVIAATVFLAGCATSEERKRKREYSNIRVHVESDQSADRSSAVTIFREHPIRINVEGEPVLDEHDVVEAALIDQPGGTFSIQVRFNRRGTWALERVSVTHRGKHLVIFSYFGQSRWLAAPEMSGKNSTGMLTFTPDATREEAERIVRGLNNVAKKLVQKENWPWSSER
jgi:hypothetical protein